MKACSVFEAIVNTLQQAKKILDTNDIDINRLWSRHPPLLKANSLIRKISTSSPCDETNGKKVHSKRRTICHILTWNQKDYSWDIKYGQPWTELGQTTLDARTIYTGGVDVCLYTILLCVFYTYLFYVILIFILKYSMFLNVVRCIDK